MIRLKLLKAIEHDIAPILCIGESIEQRDSGQTLDVINDQIRSVLDNEILSANTNMLIAYEPIWAIGTGVTASSDQAQEMHGFIREIVSDHYNEDIAQNISILYGGSCKRENAAEIFSKPDVDGGLIGGASLIANHFLSICHVTQ